MRHAAILAGRARYIRTFALQGGAGSGGQLERDTSHITSLNMGIPVHIYEDPNAGDAATGAARGARDAFATRRRRRHRFDDARFDDVFTTHSTTAAAAAAAPWGLWPRREFGDAQWASMRETKRCDGALWALWRDDGSRVCIVDANGAVHEHAARLPARITALDALDTHTVAFGLASGQHGVLDLASGRAHYAEAASSDGHDENAAITHVWARRGAHVTLARDATVRVSRPAAAGAAAATSLATTRCLTRGDAVTCADLSADAVWLALSDGHRVWLQHPHDPRQHNVPGLGLQLDERVVSLRFAPRAQLLVVATTARIIAYECGAASVALVCGARAGTLYDFDLQGALVVEQQHLYGTHVAQFQRVNGGPQWAQIGYADVRAQFGIRKVHKLRASCVGVWVVAEAGVCSEFATTRDAGSGARER